MGGLLESQKKTSNDISVIRNLQRETEQKMGEFTLRIASLEDTLEKMTFLEERPSNNEIRFLNLEKIVPDITNKANDLENRSRRNNLIVHGVREHEGESENALAKQVKDEIFSKLLGLPIQGVKRLHRLGGRMSGRTRPAILKLVDFREKILALQKYSKLKETNLSISEDFLRRVQLAWKCLWESTAEEREQNL